MSGEVLNVSADHQRPTNRTARSCARLRKIFEQRSMVLYSRFKLHFHTIFRGDLQRWHTAAQQVAEQEKSLRLASDHDLKLYLRELTDTVAPDWELWKRKSWSVEEASALWIDNCPNDDWVRRIDEFPDLTEEAAQIRLRREFLFRAVAKGELSYPVSPPAFLAWADHAGLHVPGAVRAAIADSDGAAVLNGPWPRTPIPQAEVAKPPDHVQEAHAQHRDTDEPLRTQLKAAQTKTASLQRELRTFAKLFFGIAKGPRFKYESGSQRSDTVTKILNDLWESAGIKLDPATVRDKLRQSEKMVAEELGQSRSSKPNPA